MPVLECLLASSVLLQGVGLARLSGFSGFGSSVFAICSVFLAIAVVAAWRKRGLVPHLDTLLVAAALGGVGMFIGGLIDGGIPLKLHDASMMQHHVHHAEVVGLLGSWATLLMIVFCVPVCWLFCDQPCREPSKTRVAVGHVVVCGCMLGGMFLGGLWLGPLVIWITGSQVVGAHLSMTAGMVVGTALGLWISTIERGLPFAAPSNNIRQRWAEEENRLDADRSTYRRQCVVNGRRSPIRGSPRLNTGGSPEEEAVNTTQ